MHIEVNKIRVSFYDADKPLVYQSRTAQPESNTCQLKQAKGYRNSSFLDTFGGGWNLVVCPYQIDFRKQSCREMMPQCHVCGVSGNYRKVIVALSAR